MTSPEQEKKQVLRHQPAFTVCDGLLVRSRDDIIQAGLHCGFQFCNSQKDYCFLFSRRVEMPSNILGGVLVFSRSLNPWQMHASKNIRRYLDRDWSIFAGRECGDKQTNQQTNQQVPYLPMSLSSGLRKFQLNIICCCCATLSRHLARRSQRPGRHCTVRVQRYQDLTPRNPRPPGGWNKRVERQD